MKASTLFILLLLVGATMTNKCKDMKKDKPVEEKPHDGEQKPVDGEEKPVDGEQKPVDGEQKPDDGEQRPIDGEIPVIGEPPNICTPPDGELITVTPPNPEDQRCHEVLALLSADDTSVDNNCDYSTVDGELLYHFHFYYRTPFVFDAVCLQHLIDFQGKNIPAGSAATWEYTFEGAHIQFSIRHLDLETSGCNKIIEEDQYIWQCNLGLHIWYKGFEQYDYQFVMTSTVSRQYVDILHIDISKNIVIGDCCLNILKIETELSFCSDMTCATYLPEPLVIVRKDIFYVEHRITTVEFQHYYLHNIQLKVGEFFPVIISKDSSQKGRIRWELQVNVAMNGMVVESIVSIDDAAEVRRQLATKEDVKGEDYYVKGQSGRIIVSDALTYQQQKQEIKNQKKERE